MRKVKMKRLRVNPRSYQGILWVMLSIAIVLWFSAKYTTVPTPTVPTFTLGKTMELEPIECYQPWKCTFNVVGVENVLGRSVMVHIDGIRSPRWGATCAAEDYEGERATSYLYEMLASANSVTLIRPYKVEGNHALIGRVLVDGVDVARRMIDLGVAAPPGTRINWCESTRETEV
jgi:endonuclease YncB( thermonuclease family)